MMLGARNGAWAKRGGGVPTARDYVQDGLVAMWDGIENAGWGEHDPNATKIVNLKGTGDLFLFGETSVNEDTVYFNGGYGEAEFVKTISETTIERVSDYQIDYNNNQSIILAVLSVSNICSAVSTYGTTVYNNYAYLQGSYNRFSYPINLNPRHVSTSRLGMYLDGKAVEASTTPLLSSFETERIIIAANRSKTLTRKWSFRCLRIYDRQLSEPEVMKNYAIDKARFNLP